MKKWFGLLIFILLPLFHCHAQNDYGDLRQKMVEDQLKQRDIINGSVLRAMQTVPRHRFVPEENQAYAYADTPLPIGKGQTISQPYMVAYMTQAINPKKSHKVLEIGTGSGYQAAVLAEIVQSVYTIEIVEDLGKRAKRLLDDMEYDNIVTKIGDGYHGWPEFAPFDAIVVTAGAEQVPKPLLEQLKEGGRMVIPVGPHHGVRELLLLTKKKGKIKTEKLMAVRFVPFTRQ